eukprot:CAMPEP_0201687972 /NCGR_PEP_ID=MMETSP0578-20130828/1785_1 /ASSEMBLY_ACC=CAM_ASM_000663 /TAXON_ID=267565 /ORGANISM="Skeletonema grethea, Strain CCMP 1804" /LENGTH=301 /DNA_ID=CAMNT_0048172157 /DNA_START=138 /DNA_END=1043 /DNA_ORIENTATION=+
MEDQSINNDTLANTPTTPPPKRMKCPWGKILTATILIGIITFVIIDSLTNKYISSGFEDFLTWIESNLVAGVFAFMGVYFIATVCFVPGSLLTLGSGFVFGSAVGVGYGVVLASVSVFVGASLGSIAAFLLGRYLMRDCVRNRLVKKYPVIEAIDEAMQNNGLKIFFLLRLSPIVPFNAINYIAGITAIPLRDYVLALIGILPGTILYCFVGASAGGLVEAEQGVSKPVTIASIVVGLVFAFIAVFIASYYAKKEFKKIIEQKQNSEADEGGQSEGEVHDVEEGLPPVDEQNVEISDGMTN